MKRLLLYTVITGFFVWMMWLIIEQGSLLTMPNGESQQALLVTQATSHDQSGAVSQAFTQIFHNIKHPLSQLLLQVIVILVASKVMGSVARRLGQQSVVGEILAGIALGPSLLGLYFPEVMGFIFPSDSIQMLQFLSHIGLTFFMFIVGMELDVQKLKGKTQDAMLISHASIVFPYFIGVALAYFCYETYAPPQTVFLHFALFMGISMSITAFPVLARIVQERKMSNTPLGVLVITCAAADDLTAWCVLAAIIAIVKAGTIFTALVTMGLAAAFVLLMITVVSPWLKRLSDHYLNKSREHKTLVGIAFFLLLASAYFTEIIGIHALFGAFLAGVIMPNDIEFKEALTEKISDISLIVLLPIFFAFTGLRTNLALLNGVAGWGMCALVVFLAIVGKFVGSAAAAKLVGRSWKDAVSIGALMNTRGLMELIVLNIGYDLGILSLEMFAVLVIMALVTTLTTGPMLDWAERMWPTQIVEDNSVQASSVAEPTPV